MSKQNKEANRLIDRVDRVEVIEGGGPRRKKVKGSTYGDRRRLNFGWGAHNGICR